MRILVPILILLGLPLELGAQDAFQKGEYGSHKPPIGEIASPAPGSTTSIYSHFLNPDHPGVASFMSLISNPDPESGYQIMSFGETDVSQTPANYRGYVYEAQAGINALQRSEWSSKKWDVGLHTYSRRRATLPSGTALYVFRPDSIPSGERTVLFVPVGYQGTNFSLRRSVPFTHPNDPFPTIPGSQGQQGQQPSALVPAYSQGDARFGYEIGFGPPGPRVSWILDDSIPHQAMVEGLTVVFVHFGTGRRNFWTHLAQLAEAASWLDTDEHESPAASHSVRFLYGGSYMGGLAQGAAHHMPWLFRGAIVEAGGIDTATAISWFSTLERLRTQLFGVYNHGFVNTGSLAADSISYFVDAWRGYADNTEGQLGITGKPVDAAGSGLYSRFSLATPDAFPGLHVPLLIIHQDEDIGQITFHRDLGDWPASKRFLEDIDVTSSGASQPSIDEVVIDRCEHSQPRQYYEWMRDFKSKNNGQSLLARFVQSLPSQNYPQPASDPPVEWTIGTPSGLPQFDERLRREFLDVARSEHSDGINAEQVRSPSWDSVVVSEGMGAGGLHIWNDGSDDYLIGTTARGQIVKSKILRDASDQITGFEAGAASQTWLHASDPTQVITPAQFDTSEIKLIAGDRAVVLHAGGGLYSVDLHTMTVTDESQVFRNIDTTGVAEGYIFRNLDSIPGSTEMIALNDEGDLFTFDTATSPFVRTGVHFIEGGAGPLLPVSISESAPALDSYVYSSPDGNVKRASATTPRHPSDPSDVSPHIYGYAGQLLATRDGTGQVNGYLARLLEGPWLVHLNANLTFNARTPAPWAHHPDGWLKISDSPLEVLIYNTREDEPRDLDVLGTSEIIHCRIEFTGSAGEEILVTELSKTEGISGAIAGLVRDSRIPSQFIATLHSGRTVVIPDIFTIGCSIPDNLGACFSEYHRAMGGTFGFVNFNFSSSDVPVLVALGPNDNAFALYGLRGQNLTVLDQPELNKFPTTAEWHDRNPYGTGTAPSVPPPSRGAVRIQQCDGVHYLGLPDGGAFLDTAATNSSPLDCNDTMWTQCDEMDLIAYPFPALFSDGTSQSYQKGCIRIVSFDDCSDSFVEHWRSSNIFDPGSVAVAEGTGILLEYLGNSCEWADLNGDGRMDLVAGTAGGRMYWWENHENPTYVESPTATVGCIGPHCLVPAPFVDCFEGDCDETVYAVGPNVNLARKPSGEPPFEFFAGLADIPDDMNWTGDLGGEIIGIEVVDLDGDSRDEVVVGVGFSTDLDHPKQFRTSGSVWVFGLGNNPGTSNWLMPRAIYQVTSDPAAAGGFGVAEFSESGIHGLHAFEMDGAQYIAAGTSRGRVLVLEVEETGALPIQYDLTPRYLSPSFAPMAGAYNSIFSVPSHKAGFDTRLIFATSGGIHAIDLSPTASTP